MVGSGRIRSAISRSMCRRRGCSRCWSLGFGRFVVTVLRQVTVMVLVKCGCGDIYTWVCLRVLLSSTSGVGLVGILVGSRYIHRGTAIA